MIKRFIIGLLSFFPYFMLSQTVITGLIEGNQTWTAANSPYQVTNGILKYGSKIVLEAGTKVEFKTAFVCGGEFISKGTAEQKVTLTGKWVSKSKQNIQLAYANLQNCHFETDANIELNHVSAEESVIRGHNLEVKDSEFQGGKLESQAWTSSFSMENCKLEGCEVEVSGKATWKHNQFDHCKVRTGIEAFRIIGNTFKNANVGLSMSGSSRTSNTLTFNTFEDNKTHIEMFVVEGYEKNTYVENNIFGKATATINIQSFVKTSRNGWHLGDKVPVSFKNNYWDNRPAAELQASIIDAEDNIKLAAVIGTEPQLTEKPIMKVADNPQITLPAVPLVIKHWAAEKHIPQWIFKAVGILLLGLVIQFWVKKI